MENKPDVFYIIFLKHPLLTFDTIQKIFQEFNLEMPIFEIRAVEIKKSRGAKLRLARIIKFENPPPELVNALKKITGITIKDQTEISII